MITNRRIYYTTSRDQRANTHPSANLLILVLAVLPYFQIKHKYHVHRLRSATKKTNLKVTRDLVPTPFGVAKKRRYSEEICVVSVVK